MKHFTFLAAVLIISFNGYGQLNCVADTNSFALAQSLVKLGVTVTNVQMTCPNGAAGTFTCDSCNLGIDAGVLLTSGMDTMAEGPNNSGSQGVDNFASGTNDLNNLAGANTHDACILEFDMQMLSDSVEFQYVFGSEEYIEWISSGYNDAFAFFISGPGIAGQRNIALIPGTNLPVTIDNINNSSYSQYYVSNGDGFTAPYNADNRYIQYDGFTTVLTGKIMNIVPFGIYHLKLEVADAGDGIYDSGVFLKGHSLSSNGVLLQGNHNNFRSSWSDDTAVVYRGCDTGYVQFHLLEARNHAIGVHYAIGGDAINGTDYQLISDSLVIPAGDTIVKLPIIPIANASTNPKTAVIYLLIKGTNQPYDSFRVTMVSDTFSLTLSPDASICGNNPVQLGASFAQSYNWYPSTGLSAVDEQNPVAVTSQSITYYCVATSGNCSATDSVNITVTATADATFTVTAHSLFDYTFTAIDTTGTHLWNFGDGTSSTDVNPSHTYTAQDVYTVEHIMDNGCHSQYNEAVAVIPSSIGTISNNQISLQPNPAKDEVVITLGNSGAPAAISIYNLLGEMVIKEGTDNTSKKAVNVSALSNGMYFVVVKQNGQSQTFRLLKN